MKNQFWVGLGSRAVLWKEVWGRLWATFEACFLCFHGQKINLSFAHENLKNGIQKLLIYRPQTFFSQYWLGCPNQLRIDFSYYKYICPKTHLSPYLCRRLFTFFSYFVGMMMSVRSTRICGWMEVSEIVKVHVYGVKSVWSPKSFIERTLT